MKIKQLLLSVAILTIISCENSSPIEKSIDLMDISSKLNGSYLSGAINFGKTSDSEILLGLKETGDNTYTKAFILQTETSNHLLTKVGQAELIIFNTSILLKINHELIYIGLKNELTDQIEKELKSQFSIKISNSIKGFGFSKVTGSWNLENVNFSNNHAFSVLEIFQTEDIKSISSDKIAAGCTSGGKGSSSCSTSNPLTGCSVSCSTGYYSCCDASTAKCTCLAEKK
jgi:hypothetical protein